MDIYSIDNDKKDTELDIDIDKIISSLNEPFINNEISIDDNITITKKNIIENNIIENTQTDSINFLIHNNKDIIIYTIIFFIINLNKIPLINNIDNFYINLTLKTIIFILCLYILKKYKIII